MCRCTLRSVQAVEHSDRPETPFVDDQWGEVKTGATGSPLSQTIPERSRIGRVWKKILRAKTGVETECHIVAGANCLRERLEGRQRDGGCGVVRLQGPLGMGCGLH